MYHFKWLYRHWILFIHICFFWKFFFTLKVVKLWFYHNHRGYPYYMNTLQSLLNTCITNFCDSKLRNSQNDVQQPHSSQTVNNAYTDMMLVSGTNRNQNDVVFTTSSTNTTNDIRNDDIYVENKEGEYDHLHSSRPKQVVSEMDDERYTTSTQVEDVSYSTVRKSRNSVPERVNDNYSFAASFDNSCWLLLPGELRTRLLT